MVDQNKLIEHLLQKLDESEKQWEKGLVNSDGYTMGFADGQTVLIHSLVAHLKQNEG